MCELKDTECTCHLDKPQNPTVPVQHIVSLLDTDIRHLKSLLGNIEIAKIVIENSLKEYQKIHAKTYKQFYKEYSDIAKLLDEYNENDESYYETLQRIIKEKAS